MENTGFADCQASLCARHPTCVEVVFLVQILPQGTLGILPGTKIVRFPPDRLGPFTDGVGIQREVWSRFGSRLRCRG